MALGAYVAAYEHAVQHGSSFLVRFAQLCWRPGRALGTYGFMSTVLPAAGAVVRAFSIHTMHVRRGRCHESDITIRDTQLGYSDTPDGVRVTCDEAAALSTLIRTYSYVPPRRPRAGVCRSIAFRSCPGIEAHTNMCVRVSQAMEACLRPVLLTCSLFASLPCQHPMPTVP